MPSIVRKLVIVAALDGLLLQPVTQRSQKQIPAIQIEYATNVIKSSSQANDGNKTAASLDSHGIVGTISTLSRPCIIR